MKNENSKSPSQSKDSNIKDVSTNPIVPRSVSRRHFLRIAGIGTVAL